MAQFFAFRRPTFTCDLWDYTAETQVDQGVLRKYFLARTGVKLYVQPDNLGRIYVQFGNDAADVEPRWQLRNLRDATGNEVKPGGVYQLTNFEPVFNVFEVREGFSGNAALLYDDVNIIDLGDSL